MSLWKLGRGWIVSRLRSKEVGMDHRAIKAIKVSFEYDLLKGRKADLKSNCSKCASPS